MSAHNNKFQILTAQHPSAATDGKNGTFVEAVIATLDAKHFETANLSEFIDSEKYETQSIEQDIEITQQSNLWHVTGSKQSIVCMKECSAAIKLSRSSFSTGFCFEYWAKSMEQIPDWMDREYKFRRNNGYAV